jgi:hypothetical protein
MVRLLVLAGMGQLIGITPGAAIKHKLLRKLARLLQFL